MHPISLAGSLLAILIMVAAPLSQEGETLDPSLEAFRWQNRLLLIFGSSDETMTNQLELLSGLEDEMAERDLLLLELPGEGSGQIGKSREIAPSTVGKLRERFSVSRGEFKLLLLGKDGGVKLTSSQPISGDAIFSRIDRMPMRQREMREQQADPQP